MNELTSRLGRLPFGLTCMAIAALLTGCASMDTQTDTAISPHLSTSGGNTGLQVGEGISPLERAELQRPVVAQLEAPNDMWERIRRGFAMPDLETSLVTDREAWYSERPNSLTRMAERSRMYIFHVVEELERRHMPSELALLPFVESAFNPQAVSSAKAAGMWQFMPETGKYFDLTQNVFRDDRRDILASTRAALDYLQKLHNMFGDWHLALAAYNWGEGNVSRAIARAREAGEPTDYANLRMPNETRLYVPKLQALKNIVANPDRFGVTLPEIGNHPFFETVRLTSDIDVATAAELAEIRESEFRALNPSINRPVIFAAGTPEILLPWDNAETFKRNLQARQNRRLASWTAWVAPANMSASEAARVNGMSEEEFRALNQVPPRMLVKAGSTLLVPRDETAAPIAPSVVVDRAHIAFAPEIVLRRATIKARKGDTLASIAGRYDLPASTVAEWNKLKTSTPLKRGQSIVLFLPQRAGVSRALAAESRSSRTQAVAHRAHPVAASRKAASSQQASKAGGKGPATKVAKNGANGKPHGKTPNGKKAATPAPVTASKKAATKVAVNGKR